MTLYTFTLESGQGLLGVAGLQIKGVSYYLRPNSQSVTCSYEHPRQGSDRAEDSHGTIPKQGASSTRRQLGSPGHQSLLRVLIIANVQRSTVVPSHPDGSASLSTGNCPQSHQISFFKRRSRSGRRCVVMKQSHHHCVVDLVMA